MGLISLSSVSTLYMLPAHCSLGGYLSYQMHEGYLSMLSNPSFT